jgi:pyruvate formate lyase activating enzyme
MKTPLVFDIARGSFADGPGIRTVVFLKGCPLRCPWCQNPESYIPEAETFFYPENCIKCGNCETGCSSLARQTVGQYYPAEKLAKLILRDKTFYRASGGGVTFSGGEPLLYIDYVHEAARILKKENIHIAVETCGYFDFDRFKEKLLTFIDLLFYDIKLMDPEKHKMVTGKSNELILRNFKKLLGTGVKVVPRIPLIPGYTATEENLSRAAEFFNGQKIEASAFLSYNPSGIDKWERLGKKPPGNISPKPMTREEEQKWITFFNQSRGPKNKPL